MEALKAAFEFNDVAASGLRPSERDVRRICGRTSASVPVAPPAEPSVAEEFCAIALLQLLECCDAALGEARRRLRALEADPATDELTLVVARLEVFLRRRELAKAHRQLR